MTTNDAKMSIIRIFSYEPGTKVSKQKRTLEFSIKENDEGTLEVIRQLLVEHKVLGALDVRNPFCDAAGAEVSDQMSIRVYLDQLIEKVSEDSESKAQSNGEADVVARSNEKETPKFYYKKKKVQTKTDDVTQEFLKKKLDLKIRNNPTLSPMRAQLLQSAFQSDKWAAAPAAKLSVVAELTDRDWSVIARTNCLLSGQRLTYGKDLKNPVVERTPFNAFKIKSRKFDSYEIVAPTATPVLKKDASKSTEFEGIKAHIPRFRVDDSSYVTVIETQNSLQSSMAKSSFSQSSIEASAGGGFWGVSAAAKGGFSTKKSENKALANTKEEKQMHVIYNFPRVTVYLDADSLELTDEVKEDIAEVKKSNNEESVKAFGYKYGHVFSRRVKLGGRLMSSHQSTTIAEDKKEEAENSLKAAAAVSLSGWGVSVSAEASHGVGDQQQSGETKQGFASTMSWEATGGNTVLCNDPPQWCGTVGNFRNWRVVEQSDIIPLTKFISTFDNFGSIERDFHRIAGTDVLAEDAHVCFTIQLTDVATENKLMAVPKDEENPLKTGLGKISRTLKSSSGIAIASDEAGTVKLVNSEGQPPHYSDWVLEGLIKAGRKPDFSSHTKYFIRSKRMPRTYLCLTKPIAETRDWGFLYLGTAENKYPFFLMKKGKRDPTDLKTKDTVFLTAYSKDGQNQGIVKRGRYNGDNKDISKDLDQVPSLGPKGGNGVEDSKRVLEFRVDILDY